MGGRGATWGAGEATANEHPAPPPRWRPLLHKDARVQGLESPHMAVRSLLRAPKFISADLRRESQA